MRDGEAIAAELSSSEKKRIRRALIRRQGLVCFYCEAKLVEPFPNAPSPEKARVLFATIDHIKPVSRGGTNQLNNLVLACVVCHQERHG